MYLVNTHNKVTSTSLTLVTRARHVALPVPSLHLQSVRGVSTTIALLAKFHSHELEFSKLLAQLATGLQCQVSNLISPISPDIFSRGSRAIPVEVTSQRFVVRGAIHNLLNLNTVIYLCGDRVTGVERALR